MSSVIDVIARRYHRPPVAVECCSQPDLNLPIEVILIILDQYSEERLVEVDGWSLGDYPEPEEWDGLGPPDWPILPLLTSCKLFAEILLPTIYRLVKPLSHTNFNNFLVNAPASSLKLIHTLDLTKFDHGDRNLEWQESLKDRILESQLTMFGRAVIDPAPTESPVSIVARQRKIWSQSHRPHLMHLMVAPPDTSIDDTLRVLDL